MTTSDRLKHLPPAARLAQVRPYDLAGGLLVKIRYVQKPRGSYSCSVSPGQELLGVPYEVWKQHEGHRPIRLWEWQGTGEGMIGGPAKREADFTFFGGLWEYPDRYSVGELLAHAQRLEDWLSDERYEFSPRCRAEVERKIASNRKLAGTEG
jgi:hypothetical protein